MKANLIKRIASFALALCTAATLGCSGTGSAVSTATPEPTPTAQTLLQATPSPVPVKGGTLRLSMPVNADKTDPLEVNTEEMLMLYSLVFESLIEIDNKGMLVPGLAENWSVDETGTVWTLKLRSAARWHDTGAPVTAEDVVDTYRHIVSLGASSYYSYVTKHVASMEAAGDGTLTVRMKHQGLSALYALTFPVTENASTATGNYPAGTGAYKFSYVTDDEVKLVRNDNWWKQAPNIDSVEFYARASNDVSLSSFTAGQLDMVFTSSLTVGRYREEANTAVLDMMTQTAEVMIVNYSNQYLRDVSVRRALICAINRSRIITNVYMNRARTADVPVPPDSWLYESKSAVYDYSEETAKNLLAGAGWADTDGDGFIEKDGNKYEEMTLRILVNDSSDAARKTAAEQIAAQLEAVGIHTELTVAAYTLGDDQSEYLVKLRSGEFDLALAGFNLGRDFDLTAYLSTGGTNNYGKYSNAAIEQLASNILSAATEKDCIEAASKLQIAFSEELPFIVLYFRLNSLVYNTDIKGISDIREPDVLRNIASWYIASEVE